MIKTNVIIVGGGPAGSSCAWQLRRRGLDSLILDKAVFPRPKLCAGWITPEVVADLEMDIAAYPHRLLTFEVTRAHLFGIGLTMRSPQHSIRRVEFDHWLLERSGAEVIRHQVKHVERTPNGYRIDDRFECVALVGAGGTACPVYRSLFREINPRARGLQVAALEQELPYTWQDRDCHLWFFEKGLPGYSWYVPKQDGYLNLGVGGMTQRMQDTGASIHRHWEHFVTSLRRRKLIDEGLALEPWGYSYYLRDGVQKIRHENAFLVGDAAGLATRDMAEGIGPAIRSGILAANAIADGGEYSLESVSPYSLGAGLPRRALEYGLSRRWAASPAAKVHDPG
ncbi:NAD(P)/FAD-dependent oxidoreductase [Thiocapsa bogorovii]|uniref:NAD(P)/FAD-dependent oxidoreductase n=1 Tax=Thiocapsa bogorovii TaxID=521689 RepID=UPI001E38DB27|nr:NAD(P)/FAD-dependent oxidoreductase [Thiocapsa bogorovii]UHD16842.1 NAD(P)/FAD-dependent oxidoreductase [Thiocapsa bogorovii]